MHDMARKYTARFVTQPENKSLCLKHIFVIIQVSRVNSLQTISCCSDIKELNSLLHLKCTNDSTGLRVIKAFIHANQLFKLSK